jgi:hypothetical protein
MVADVETECNLHVMLHGTQPFFGSYSLIRAYRIPSQFTQLFFSAS